MHTTQREYKDRLFHFIFGNEENRAWTLSLYNAINGTTYDNPEDIELNTIREVLYLGMHNDVSFLIYYELNLFEQQSTFNPNMPLREMQYAGNLYEKYIVENRLDKYSKYLIELPVPKLVVFYNGTDAQPDEIILKLSDAFPEEKRAEADIEVRVRMININYGHNKEIMQACKPLQEYSWVVRTIREKHAQGETLEQAIEYTIRTIPGDYVIRSFLEGHRAEVKGMLLTEYNEAETIEIARENSRKEGIKEGIEKGTINTLLDLVKDGLLSLKDAASRAGISETDFEARMRAKENGK